MSKKGKKNVNLTINEELLKELNHALVDKYGNVFGHVSEAFEEGIKLWLGENNNGDKSE